MKKYLTVLLSIVGGLVVTFSLITGFSTANPLDQPAAVNIPPEAALYTKRAPHPACPTCFTVTEENRYGIYEEVPGTGVLIPREIPDPAPLQVGERRVEFDEEGSPVWYVGQQGIVGPTDEEPASAELSVPKIELRRIQARHMNEVFRIRGVNGFGIGAKGFVVMLDPQQLKNEARIPTTLEGIPVEVEIANTPILSSHTFRFRAPVPISSGIEVQRGDPIVSGGTLGPHIVRGPSYPGIPCCQIWSLTASHVVQYLQGPTPAFRGRDLMALS